jgi:hypothetical protein
LESWRVGEVNTVGELERLIQLESWKVGELERKCRWKVGELESWRVGEEM